MEERELRTEQERKKGKHANIHELSRYKRL